MTDPNRYTPEQIETTKAMLNDLGIHIKAEYRHMLNLEAEHPERNNNVYADNGSVILSCLREIQAARGAIIGTTARR